MKNFLRFCGAGGVGVLLYCVLLFVLTELAGLWYPLSAGVAYAANVISNFFFHRHWTFKAASLGTARRQAIGYFSLSLVLCPVNSWLLYLVVENTNLWYWHAQAIVTTFLVSISYLISRRYIFAN